MINKILHAVSNRALFYTPLFVPQPGFLAAVLSSDAQNLRTALLLNVLNTDYYLKIYLGLLEAYPDLKAQFNDWHTSYEVTDFLPRGVLVDGGDFLSAPNIAGTFTDPPNTTLPVNLTYLIDYQSANLCNVTLVEQGNSQLVSYQLFGKAPEQILSLDWPDTLPFVGQIKLTQNWTLNSRVQIFVEPSQFPYDLILASAERWPYLNTLLVSYGMNDAYAYSVETTEKLAIIITLLGLSNPAIQL